MMSIVDIDKLIEELKKALNKFDEGADMVFFCVDCMRVVNGEEDEHYDKKHTVILTNIDHDGIGEWIRCLEWVKRYLYV
jgi:hypothetical protein